MLLSYSSCSEISLQNMASEEQFAQMLSSHKEHGDNSKAAYYTRLYTQHRVWMLRHVMKFGINEADAEEVVQEAFVRLLKLDEPNTHSYLRSYLQRIASNIAIDRYRRKQRSPEVESTEIESDSFPYGASPSPEQTESGKQILKLLNNILQELPPKCRTAFYMYKVQGHSYTEVAEHLGLSESMVRKYVLKALRYSYSELKDLL